MPRDSEEDKPENHACENCEEHQASVWWIGDGGILAVTRYHMQFAWCRHCALEVEIAHAEEMSNKLLSLKQELETTSCEPVKEAS